MVVISCHFVKMGDKIFSPLVDNLEILLKENKIKYLVIAHSLNQDFESSYYDEEQNRNKIKYISTTKSPLRYINEVITSTLFLFNKNFKDKVYFIGINPLNALVGFIYKQFNKNCTLIYYVPDYSKVRFTNKALNYIYKSIEEFVSKKSDYLLCVSEKIYNLKLESNKNSILYKNYPPKSIVPKPNLRKRDINSIYLLGLIDDFYLIEEIISALEILNKETNIKLKIIGAGKMLDTYKEYIDKSNISDRVEFLGFIEKSKVLNEISKYGINLAMYSGKQDYDEYRDSVKTRDSIACGVPTIMTDTCYNVIEIEKNILGKVIYMNKKNIQDQIVASIKDIIKNYSVYMNNNLKYYDKDCSNEKKLLEILN